jgi:hypothetical protein
MALISLPNTHLNLESVAIGCKEKINNEKAATLEVHEDFIFETIRPAEIKARFPH